MHQFASEYVDSDDMEEILAMTRDDLPDSGHQTAGPSRVGHPPTYVQKQEFIGRIAALEAEIAGVDADMAKLRALRTTLVAERQGMLVQLTSNQSIGATTNINGKGKLKATAGTTDYNTERFEWSGELKARMKAVFDIGNFRLCQEGVCNANMDGRDIVCVMPTGGGKSLTYQLPALLNPGCTLVISPLISLITDQILHLREAGVEAVMLTGSTSKEESRDIFSRLIRSAGGGRGRTSYAPADHIAEKEIKLCYVTPEKIAKSKTFTSMLEKLSTAGKLARIVIDEAHCVSQLGHDFRPDYKKLSILRQLFPRVPILALSATCPPKVLKDLIMTLRLKPVVDGKAAGADGTVYFSAPLYRKNLHYTILPKPASASAVIQTMTDYILKEHRNDSGIVYCLSKKDAETVATGIMETSEGKIRTGVYHSEVGDKEKEGLHKRWRRGDVKVVCATIAFGLGIDKGDVRFVLHHSMSKSLDGYYQESGRAGRDGKDSDCILYYRPQDATRLSALVCGELEGQGKLHDMLKFAQEVEDCRKLQFAKYFSTSSSLSISSWATEESNALDRCGHCDNCTRPPESIERKDVTVEAWQILKVAGAVENDGGRVTLGMLGDLVRGAGGGAYGVAAGGRKGKGNAKEKIGLDLDAIAGGKVTLPKDDVETLLVHLVLSQHLKESFHSTAYSINVYVLPGNNAMRLTRWSREDLQSGKGPRMMMSFAKKAGKKGTKSAKGGDAGPSKTKPIMTHLKLTGAPARKRRRAAGDSEGDEGDDRFVVPDEDGDEDFSEQIHRMETDMPVSSGPGDGDAEEEEEEDEGPDGWAFTLNAKSQMRDKLGTKNEKRRRLDRPRPSSHIKNDVIVLSSSE